MEKQNENWMHLKIWLVELEKENPKTMERNDEDTVYREKGLRGKW